MKEQTLVLKKEIIRMISASHSNDGRATLNIDTDTHKRIELRCRDIASALTYMDALQDALSDKPDGYIRINYTSTEILSIEEI